MKNKIKVSDVYPGRLNEVASGRISVAKFVEELNQIITEKVQPQPIEKLFELKEDTAVWVKPKYSCGHEFGRYIKDGEEDEKPVIIVNNSVYYHSRAINSFTHFLIAEVPKF